MNLRCGEAGLKVRCLVARRVESALMGGGRPLCGSHSVPQRRYPAACQQRLPLQGLNLVLQYQADFCAARAGLQLGWSSCCCLEAVRDASVREGSDALG